ncbi:hypothetical protein BU24DRAFT_424426 [Aaosphaeria arxii CBS 175.79]|uniref:DUF3752 domain-containing protein n=1 Tax=Aaosphaeria arxii CBS 175.79 TaxID=1450172 RepID=A0A6A5XJH9_9PLEO|nr:uncharacterized protein BU24DRAFT_424426 [Aaosphaeria arxii CBS 175.79]KAF2013428.1 hypothetical protein BU24DRAFT_424426 [Aaosphaeria arxii CBS 175.79]
MPTVGPSLPPHLAKRGRDEDDNERSTSPESSEKRQRVAGPARPPRISGPSLPPRPNSRSSSPDSDIGPAPPPSSKPARVLGPALPPAPLSERPPNPPSDDSDSSDDDFGPAPPPAGGVSVAYDAEDTNPGPSAFDTDPKYTEESKKVQRDEWMTMPPTQDDLAARMDPTKIRARKFNTGKGAKGPSGGGGMGVWTETPEQKLKRLQNEALGVAAPSNSEEADTTSRRSQKEEDQARRMREKIDASRGKSLMEKHKDSGTGKDKEDDPSKRSFDWKKDMGGGTQIGHKQRNEMLSKAKGFGDRFSGGSFL